MPVAELVIHYYLRNIFWLLSVSSSIFTSSSFWNPFVPVVFHCMILATDATTSENSGYERVMSAVQDLTFKDTNNLKTREGEKD